MPENKKKDQDSFLGASFLGRLKAFYFLPPREKTNRFLPVIIGVMAFLTLLGSATGLAIFNGSKAWSSDLKQTLTVQIVHPDARERTRQTNLAIGILEETPGVQTVERMDERDLKALLEPWLGVGNVTDDLPIPEMLSVILSPGVRLDGNALNVRIRERAPDASVDDHQQWIGQLSSLSTMVQAAVFISIALVALTTIALVVFATKAALAAHRETVEIVHLMGAKDSLISGEFRKLFMLHGFKGGVMGLVAALLTISIFVYLAGRIGGGLLPQFSLNGFQVLALGAVPFLTALLTMWTADATVRHALRQLV